MMKPVATKRFSSLEKSGFKIPRKTEQSFMLRGNLPFDSNGVISLPQLPRKDGVQDFFEKRGLTEEIVFEKCEEVFTEFIHALCKADSDKISALTEKGFGEKINACLPSIKDFNLKFSTEPK
jgi:hypothetical protein